MTLPNVKQKELIEKLFWDCEKVNPSFYEIILYGNKQPMYIHRVAPPTKNKEKAGIWDDYGIFEMITWILFWPIQKFFSSD